MSTAPVFSDQSEPFRRYAVACPECGWETDVVGGRVTPYHTVRRMTRDGITPTDDYCTGSGTEAERVTP